MIAAHEHNIATYTQEAKFAVHLASIAALKRWSLQLFRAPHACMHACCNAIFLAISLYYVHMCFITYLVHLQHRKNYHAWAWELLDLCCFCWCDANSVVHCVWRMFTVRPSSSQAAGEGYESCLAVWCMNLLLRLARIKISSIYVPNIYQSFMIAPVLMPIHFIHHCYRTSRWVPC